MKGTTNNNQMTKPALSAPTTKKTTTMKVCLSGYRFKLLLFGLLSDYMPKKKREEEAGVETTCERRVVVAIEN